MEVITIDSNAFRALEEKINAISDYVFALQAPAVEDEDRWVDSWEICHFLRISERTLQRLRSNGKITYSNLGGKFYYQISEVKRLMRERVIKSTDEMLANLLKSRTDYEPAKRDKKKRK